MTDNIRERFTCLRRDSGDCVKDMCGNIACEFCDIYADCVFCGLKGTTLCETCLIKLVNDMKDKDYPY